MTRAKTTQTSLKSLSLGSLSYAIDIGVIDKYAICHSAFERYIL